MDYDDRHYKLLNVLADTMTAAAFMGIEAYENDDTELMDALSDASRAAGHAYELLYERLYPKSI